LTGYDGPQPSAVSAFSRAIAEIKEHLNSPEVEVESARLQAIEDKADLLIDLLLDREVRTLVVERLTSARVDKLRAAQEAITQLEQWIIMAIETPR